MEYWADYSTGRPTAAALAAMGIKGVIRYVGLGGATKRLTRDEYQDLTEHGITVWGVVEQFTTDANGGYDHGRLYATIARADIAYVTSGDGLPVVFAANDQQSATADNLGYVQAFADVFGYDHTGVYGFASFIAMCQDANVASHYWLCGHPPVKSGMDDGTITLWQRQGSPDVTPSDGPSVPTTTVLNGVTIDLNNFYGHTITPPPPPVVSAHPGDDVMFIRCVLKAGQPPAMALLCGPIFCGLSGNEITSALAAIDKGATVLDVGVATWTALDMRSHSLCDLPTPVVVVPPVKPAQPSSSAS